MAAITTRDIPQRSLAAYLMEVLVMTLLQIYCPCVVLRYVALRFGANAALGYDYSCAGTSGAQYLFLRPINDRVGFPGQSRHILVDFDYWDKVVSSPLLSCR